MSASRSMHIGKLEGENIRLKQLLKRVEICVRGAKKAKDEGREISCHYEIENAFSLLTANNADEVQKTR